MAMSDDGPLGRACRIVIVKKARRRATPQRILEITQGAAIHPVQFVAAKRPRHELHLPALLNSRRGKQLFSHPLDARGIREEGVPVKQPGDVEQQSTGHVPTFDHRSMRCRST